MRQTPCHPHSRVRKQGWERFKACSYLLCARAGVQGQAMCLQSPSSEPLLCSLYSWGKGCQCLWPLRSYLTWTVTVHWENTINMFWLCRYLSGTNELKSWDVEVSRSTLEHDVKGHPGYTILKEPSGNENSMSTGTDCGGTQSTEEMEVGHVARKERKLKTDAGAGRQGS